MVSLSEIWSFPVKSLPGIELTASRLVAGEGLLNDRRFAFTKTVGNSLDGKWLTSRSFFINAVDDGLQRFSLALDGQTLRLTSPENQEIVVTLGDKESLQAANDQLATFIFSLDQHPAMPEPKLVERKQTLGEMSGYWDFSDSAVSIINAASVRELGKTIKTELDIRRFRGNLIVDDMPPWEELGWPGHRLRVGEVEFEVLRPAMRCPATSVNPQTGYRDLTVPDDMQEALGHLACGIYARTVKSGTIEKGDPVKTIGEGEFPLDEALRGGGPDYRLWPKPATIESAKGTAKKRNLSIVTNGRWGIPEAAAGQRWRLHLEGGIWGMGVIENADKMRTNVAIEKSPTDDPATDWLLNEAKPGDPLFFSGPFGKRS